MKKRLLKWGKRLILLCAGLAVFALACVGYAFLEFRTIGTTRLGLQSEDPALQGLRIVYAADFQYDIYRDDRMYVDHALFQRAIDKIGEQNADIILLGGDYITFYPYVEEVIPYLAQLEAPLGVYGVFGNHDHGAEQALMDSLPNIRFLQNEAVTLAYHGAEIMVYGVEDYWYGEAAVNPETINDTASYRILLTHNPDFYEALTQGEREWFDLMLAGHTHGGQLTCFGVKGIPQVLRVVTRYGERYRYGEVAPYGRRVYVTSGLGGTVYGWPVRFGARPEIVVMEQR